MSEPKMHARVHLAVQEYKDIAKVERLLNEKKDTLERLIKQFNAEDFRNYAQVTVQIDKENADRLSY